MLGFHSSLASWETDGLTGLLLPTRMCVCVYVGSGGVGILPFATAPKPAFVSFLSLNTAAPSNGFELGLFFFLDGGADVGTCGAGGTVGALR